MRVIDEKPANLNDYGLTTPRIEVDFKATGDKDYRTLLIGQKSPTGGNLFAKKKGEDKVFLIAGYQEPTFNKTTFDLRDKAALHFDRDKVDRIAIDAGGKGLELAKAGNDWNISKPLKTASDFSAVEGLIGRLMSAQMKSIASDTPSPADLKKYGLDKPTATVTLGMGSATAALQIGGKSPDGSVYAKDASKPDRHDDRQRARRRAEEGRRTTTAARSSSRSAPTTPPASSSRAAARPWPSTRSRAASRSTRTSGGAQATNRRMPTRRR